MPACHQWCSFQLACLQFVPLASCPVLRSGHDADGLDSQPDSHKQYRAAFHNPYDLSRPTLNNSAHSLAPDKSQLGSTSLVHAPALRPLLAATLHAVVRRVHERHTIDAHGMRGPLLGLLHARPPRVDRRVHCAARADHLPLGVQRELLT